MKLLLKDQGQKAFKEGIVVTCTLVKGLNSWEPSLNQRRVIKQRHMMVQLFPNYAIKMHPRRGGHIIAGTVWVLTANSMLMKDPEGYNKNYKTTEMTPRRFIHARCTFEYSRTQFGV